MNVKNSRAGLSRYGRSLSSESNRLDEPLKAEEAESARSSTKVLMDFMLRRAFCYFPLFFLLSS